MGGFPPPRAASRATHLKAVQIAHLPLLCLVILRARHLPAQSSLYNLYIERSLDTTAQPFSETNRLVGKSTSRATVINLEVATAETACHTPHTKQHVESHAQVTDGFQKGAAMTGAQTILWAQYTSHYMMLPPITPTHTHTHTHSLCSLFHTPHMSGTHRVNLNNHTIVVQQKYWSQWESRIPLARPHRTQHTGCRDCSTTQPSHCSKSALQMVCRRHHYQQNSLIRPLHKQAARPCNGVHKFNCTRTQTHEEHASSETSLVYATPHRARRTQYLPQTIACP